MTQDGLVRNLNRTADHLFRLLDLLPDVADRLSIGKIERRRETNPKIVTEFVLGQRHAVAIGDLAARRRNIENVGARQFLRFESWNNCFLFRRRTSARSGVWWQRLRRSRAHRDQQKTYSPQIAQIFADYWPDHF